MLIDLVVVPLLSEYEVDRGDKAGEARKMIPLQGVALDEQHGEQREDHKRDNLLDNLQLPQREGASELGTADTVGGNLKAVLKECYAPANQHDGNHAVTLQTRLKGDVAIPRERHKDI